MVFHTPLFPSFTLPLSTGTPGGPTSRRRKDQGFLGASHILKPDGGLKVKKAEKFIVKEFTYDYEKHSIISEHQLSAKFNFHNKTHLHSNPINVLEDPKHILYYLHSF